MGKLGKFLKRRGTDSHYIASGKNIQFFKDFGNSDQNHSKILFHELISETS